MNWTGNNPELRKLPIGERIIFAFLFLFVVTGLAGLIGESPALTSNPSWSSAERTDVVLVLAATVPCALGYLAVCWRPIVKGRTALALGVDALVVLGLVSLVVLILDTRESGENVGIPAGVAILSGWLYGWVMRRRGLSLGGWLGLRIHSGLLSSLVWLVVLASLVILPQLWGQWDENWRRAAVGKPVYCAPEQLREELLKRKSWDERISFLQDYARTNRPATGVREILSPDGKVYVAIAADGNGARPDGESIRFEPKGSDLNIAIAGNGSHRWDAFLFGRGGNGGSIEVAYPAQPCGDLIVLCGSGGYGGFSPGAAGAWADVGSRPTRGAWYVGGQPGSSSYSWDDPRQPGSTGSMRSGFGSEWDAK